MEQRVDGIVCSGRARPDRHRKQHDIGAGEACHGETAEKLPPCVLARVEGFRREFRGLEPDPAERIDERRRAWRRFLEYDGCPASGKIGSRRGNARYVNERFLDFAHAAAARHVLDGKRYGLMSATRPEGSAHRGGEGSGRPF